MVPTLCETCGGILYEDTLFNMDMARNNIRRMRFSCFNDHGVVIDGPAPAARQRQKLCNECGEPIDEALPPQTKIHPTCRARLREHGEGKQRTRFKSGFVNVAVDNLEEYL
jgi:hypothetical protein